MNISSQVKKDIHEHFLQTQQTVQKLCTSETVKVKYFMEQYFDVKLCGLVFQILLLATLPLRQKLGLSR